MNKGEKSLLDTDIISEIIKRANPRIIAKANSYLNQFDKYTLSVITVMEITEGWHKRKQEQRLQQFLTILTSTGMSRVFIGVFNLGAKSISLISLAISCI